MKKNAGEQGMLWMPACMSVGSGLGMAVGAIIDRITRKIGAKMER